MCLYIWYAALLTGLAPYVNNNYYYYYMLIKATLFTRHLALYAVANVMKCICVIVLCIHTVTVAHSDAQMMTSFCGFASPLQLRLVHLYPVVVAN